MGGSPGCFRAVSGGSAPDAGLPEPEQGTSAHFHTSSTGRALLFAQDRRWTGSTVIFVIALVDFKGFMPGVMNALCGQLGIRRVLELYTYRIQMFDQYR